MQQEQRRPFGWRRSEDRLPSHPFQSFQVASSAPRSIDNGKPKAKVGASCDFLARAQATERKPNAGAQGRRRQTPQAKAKATGLQEQDKQEQDKQEPHGQEPGRPSERAPTSTGYCDCHCHCHCDCSASLHAQALQGSQGSQGSQVGLYWARRLGRSGRCLLLA